MRRGGAAAPNQFAQPMKRRWLIRIVVLLLVGAIINVAVAWGCSMWIFPTNGRSPITIIADAHGHTLAICVDRAFGRTRVNRLPAQLFNRILPKQAVDYIVQANWVGERGSTDFLGWPCRSFRCSNDSAIVIFESAAGSIAFDGDPTAKLTGGIQLSPWPPGSGPGMTPKWRALPFHVIGSGFVFNTIFYALVWCALFDGFRPTRRFIRRKLGRCAGCGYDLRGQVNTTASSHITCPECGAASSIALHR
jgi:hypothetical protein